MLIMFQSLHSHSDYQSQSIYENDHSHAEVLTPKNQHSPSKQLSSIQRDWNSNPSSFSTKCVVQHWSFYFICRLKFAASLGLFLFSQQKNKRIYSIQYLRYRQSNWPNPFVSYFVARLMKTLLYKIPTAVFRIKAQIFHV